MRIRGARRIDVLRVWRCGRAAAVWTVASLCAACVVTPADRINGMAAGYGFARETVRGVRFEHVIYRSAAADVDVPLHVYIEGDGSPYLDEATIARDATPRTPVMLTLMALDGAPSVYLGRPCYFGLQAADGCTPVYWTVGRFNEQVVASMAAVIDRFRRARSADGLVLIGHSGGAALAVLLAQRLANVDAVVTLAGNLDTAAWTALHGYSPLDLSLNPSDRPLTAVPLVLHLAGAEDDVLPPALIAAAAQKIGGRLRVVPQMGHTCCWEQVWPSVLDGVP
jgi:pimeloyl-ACP methyl ester carboxylesterase